MGIGDYIERLRFHRATQLWALIALVMVILCFVFLVIQFVLVGESDQRQLYAIELHTKKHVAYPKIAVCPFSEEVNPDDPPSIQSVQCEYFHGASAPVSLGVTTAQFVINDFFNPEEPTNCFDVNAAAITPNHVTDVILCAVKTNYSIWWSPYNPEDKLPSSRWFDWNILTPLEAVAFGLDAEVYLEDGKSKLEYQITKRQREVRSFQPGTGMSLFTVQFTSFVVSSYYGYHSYSFWTALGVIGGFFLIMYLLALAFFYLLAFLFRMDTSEYKTVEGSAPL
jgi:hypothetical protein